MFPHPKDINNVAPPNYPVGNYMFKVNNRNIRKRSEMCSKLTIKTPGVSNSINGFFVCVIQPGKVRSSHKSPEKTHERNMKHF